jgi:hypothetical protein
MLDERNARLEAFVVEVLQREYSRFRNEDEGESKFQF